MYNPNGAIAAILILVGISLLFIYAILAFLLPVFVYRIMTTITKSRADLLQVRNLLLRQENRMTELASIAPTSTKTIAGQ